jgi:geranylgeranyl diphosphate synthase type II
VTRDPSSLGVYLGELKTEIDAALERVLASHHGPPVIATPVRYALTGPGKRLRPCLTLASAEAVAERVQVTADTARTLALPAACAVEMIHTYSLVHDDLPAMDDDTLRRGRPTTHVVYGDGLAILAGDGLLTEAFGLLARWPSPACGDRPVQTPPADRCLRAIRVLAEAAGVAGMVGGQAIDLDGSAHDPASLEDLHLRKTGALIRAASTIGAILAGAPDAAIAAIDAYARDLGLAFQIIDDVLDVEGSNAGLGKTPGKDAAQGKPTFPAVYGVEPSRRLAVECIARAKAALAAEGFGGRLAAIADWSLVRAH